MVNEVQEVYRLQGANINDKHLEVIVRQMLRWVKIDEIGDTEFLPEEVVDRFKFKTENTRAIESGGPPSRGNPILLGITKASLSTDSFTSTSQKAPNALKIARRTTSRAKSMPEPAKAHHERSHSLGPESIRNSRTCASR